MCVNSRWVRFVRREKRERRDGFSVRWVFRYGYGREKDVSFWERFLRRVVRRWRDGVIVGRVRVRLVSGRRAMWWSESVVR